MKKRFFNKKHVSASYRSGLEEKVATELTNKNIHYGYETEKLDYVVPEKKHKYTPDFILTKKNGEKMYIETKGYWPRIEQQKTKYILQSNPGIDLRIVFSNAGNKISKSSRTTYGDIAIKLNILFANKTIPDTWLLE